MSSGADFYPNRDAERVLWLRNVRGKVEGYLKGLGFEAKRVKGVVDGLDGLVGSFEAKDKAYATYKAQVAAHEALEKTAVADLRKLIREIKANPGCTDAMKADLQIEGSSSSTASQGNKSPSLSAEAHPGFVRLSFRKLGFDSVNVYARLRGESAWHFLARDTHSPYDDHRPLATPGTPEVREYRLIGVVKDEEQGLPTDAAALTVAPA
ncbi:MAG TPA: hypothetical protein PKE31_16920 [Pseudomonadota bacterium]|nr:hypothetical protein [Pseudomonadota bacterium]